MTVVMEWCTQMLTKSLGIVQSRKKFAVERITALAVRTEKLTPLCLQFFVSA
jgi:hypothetical protein